MKLVRTPFINAFPTKFCQLESFPKGGFIWKAAGGDVHGGLGENDPLWSGGMLGV
jgi:hypothetical protein